MSDHTEPGLYPDINFADYQALPFINHTKLRWGEKSSRHMDWALRGLLDRKSTESMLMGRLIHCAVLEGMDQAEFRFPLAEPCGVPRKSGANKGVPCGNASTRQLNGEWFCGVHAPEGATTLEDYATEADFETVKQLNHELRLHPVVKLLRQFGGCELTFIADIDGVRCKGRIDKYIQARPSIGLPATVIDLKTIQPGEGAIEKCRSAAASYGYHVQAAMYQAALQSILGVDEVSVVLVFIEKNAPFDCTVIQATELDMNIGRSDLMRWLGIYKEGMRTGNWPGVCADIEHGLLPERYTRSYTGNYA